MDGGISRAAILPIALAVAYPLLSHASVLLHAPLLQWLALCCFAAVPLAAGLMARRARSWLIFIAIALLLWAVTHIGGGQYALYLPPLVFTATLASTFALSLRKGHTPLIVTFAAIARGGELPPDLAAYCRKLTAFWACMVAAIFATTLYLTLFGPLWLWSWHTNFASYVVIGAVFIAEFFLRRIWFAHLPHGSFWQYLKFMTRVRAGDLR